MDRRFENIGYGYRNKPELMWPLAPVSLEALTMAQRMNRVLCLMEDEAFDVLCIYADREHGGNFGYLTGFEPRFEEAMLVLHKDGRAFLLLGNESLRMGTYCRLENSVIHVPYFSLPNQPMETEQSLKSLIRQAGLQAGMSAGIVGWKLFTSSNQDNEQIYEVPYMIVDAIKNIIGASGNVRNGGKLFLDPRDGARIIHNANEIAHFEYGAGLASNCVLNALDAIEPGKTEIEVASCLAFGGQPVNVQTICATGERFTNAEVAPRNKKIAIGDTFSVTMGLRGGLTSRAGYVSWDANQLPDAVGDYLDIVAKPYFAASVKWYETMGIGISGGEIYKAIDNLIPKSEFGWELNPGHLTASEEWLCSPISKDSSILVKSGMMFQMDIIPKRAGYGGSNAEDGIVIADAALRNEIKEKYPDVWERMQKRRTYMQQELGIKLKDEVLPMSNSAGYLRPFLLEKDKAFFKSL